MSRIGRLNKHLTGIIGYTLLFLCIDFLYQQQNISHPIRVQWNIHYPQELSYMERICTLILYLSCLLPALTYVLNPFDILLTTRLVRQKRKKVYFELWLVCLVKTLIPLVVKMGIDSIVFKTALDLQMLDVYLHVLLILLALTAISVNLYFLKVKHNYIYLMPIVLISIYLFVRKDIDFYPYDGMISLLVLLLNGIGMIYLIKKYEHI